MSDQRRKGARRPVVSFFIEAGNRRVEVVGENRTKDDPEMMEALQGRALEDMASLLDALQNEYGLVVNRSSGESFAYHWHTPMGECLAKDAREGFSSVAAAIMGGLAEMAQIWKLSGQASLAAGLLLVGIDVSNLALSMPPDANEEERAKVYATALGNALEAIRETTRSQPSGFSGEIVGAFLALARDVVRICGADAHSAIGASGGVPIPAMLPAGSIAIPAQAVLILENLLTQIEGTNGGPHHDRRANIANTA